MKGRHHLVLSFLALATWSCKSTTSAASISDAHMVISPVTSRAETKGSPANFTGSVTIAPLFSATPYTRAAGASVTFDPGARSAWHSHPAGQTLIVTAGSGWIQEWGIPKRELKVGDVVWTPPGVKHWHGATADEAMTHIAVQENVDGKVVDWMDQVSDDEYRR